MGFVPCPDSHNAGVRPGESRDFRQSVNALLECANIMDTTNAACSDRHSKSPVLKLDVGGTVFRMTKASIDHFPNSLLADMVKACPEALDSEKPVFIDRSPKGFEVILEIYR